MSSPIAVTTTLDDTGSPVKTKSATKRSRDSTKDPLTVYSFITPALVGYAVFVILPIVGGLALSFFEWGLFGTPYWIGLENYYRLLGDPRVWQSLYVTFAFLLGGMLPTILLGFMLANLLNTKFPGIGILRTIYFIPMTASAAVAGVLWANVYRNRTGVLNQVIQFLGFDGRDWLSDVVWARPALIVVMVWLGLPLVIILYLAGLQGIPEEIYDAASIDGAGRWRQLWSMTWPSVWSTTIIVGVMQFIGFMGGAVEISLIMTGGGPLGETTSLALYAYQIAFDRREMGYASAITVFQLAVVLIVIVSGYGVKYFRWRWSS